MAESEEELKSLLMRMKKKSEKTLIGLKLSIHKTKIIASGPITSWQIEGEKVEKWQILFSWAPKSLQTVTAAMKLTLTPWKSYEKQLDSVLKSRDITLLTEARLVKAMVFPVVMYRCESWTIKKAESWRIDVWTVVLEKTPGNPLGCKEIKSVDPKGN